MTKKAFLAFLLTAILLLLVSCSGNKEDTSTSGTEQSSQAGESQGSNYSQEGQAEQNTQDYEGTEEQEGVGSAFNVSYANARTYTSNLGWDYVYVIFEVTNTSNYPLYLTPGSFDLEDEKGEIFTSKSGVSVTPSIINPGEKAYYHNEIELSEQVSALNVIPRPHVEETTGQNTRFSVTNVSLKDDDLWGIKAVGKVENTGDEEASNFYVTLVLYDANNNPIGCMSSIIQEKIAPGERIDFEVDGSAAPRDISPSAVSRFETYAYPDAKG